MTLKARLRPAEQTKICSVCGKRRALTKFHRRADGIGGRMAACASCKSEHRTANGHHAKVMRRWRTMNRERIMVYHARERARKLGVPFDLALDDIIIPEVCPVLDIPLDRAYGHLNANTPSLDRVDNTKGYVRGNVVVVSHRANTLKNDATLDEIERLAAYMRKHLTD